MDERVLEMAEAAQQERLQQAIDNRVVYQGESATECKSCGDDIPEARRLAVPGCRFCVCCRGVREVRGE
ncbi:TraR/DksA C4-type zinc finger protein [Ectopseudomonas alcaliphila]|uniref:Phage/conjugal plasmid C-4 type zinc finger protein, TraR family n=1 Tax=Ectopseudomonas alcaliphila TaxID=101564 RepID=A0A1G7MNW6_9GAMM|nr:TraR/DksA C4-type zinc finger protein [Pseudomonas alcaliphila]MDX5994925.1 TraR/DksA C4-type zinc finger protein [Pseudomonas alcaliphila]SDF63381.1 phage/conjugal plasmid C-4 type zinc finger protein, TraR family [Pseudomonas alcaliphila]